MTVPTGALEQKCGPMILNWRLFCNTRSTYTFDYAAEDYNWNGSGSFSILSDRSTAGSLRPLQFDLDAAVTDVLAPSGDDM